jgi:hypothetical protein
MRVGTLWAGPSGRGPRRPSSVAFGATFPRVREEGNLDPLPRRAPVGRENLPLDFALQAVGEMSPGARQEAGDLPVDLLPALPLERVDQTPSHSPELRADIVCDRRRAVAA